MVASVVPAFRGAPEDRAEFERRVRDALAELATASDDHEQVARLRELVDALAAQPAAEFDHVRGLLSSEPIARPVLELMAVLLGRVEKAARVPSNQDPFAAIEHDLEARIATMQGPAARARAQAAFEANPEALGAAAVVAAKRRA